MSEKICKVTFENAKFSAEPIVFEKYDPSLIDFEQTWRIHLLDMLAPYCEHNKSIHEKSAMGKTASELWRLIMQQCSEWETAQGF